jgi:hypothetical protein
MREKDPEKDDWGKPLRLLKYLNGTWYIKLILSTDEMNFTIHWYIDRLHLQEDCRGRLDVS